MGRGRQPDVHAMLHHRFGYQRSIFRFFPHTFEIWHHRQVDDVADVVMDSSQPFVGAAVASYAVAGGICVPLDWGFLKY